MNRRDVFGTLILAPVAWGHPLGNDVTEGEIPRSFITELIRRANIVAIIGARVPLKEAGGEYRACCPFHAEKTPSFWVSPEKQLYHCFECGAHGTVLDFLMALDRMSESDAVYRLAQQLGLEVPRHRGQENS